MTVAFNPDVDLTVEISFVSNPYDTAPTYVDVSADVDEIDIFRGRSDDLDTIGPGTLTLTLRNESGDYDPNNAGGAHNPNVKPMRQVRIRAVHNSITYDLWKGWISSWPQAYPDQKASIAICSGFDGLGFLGNVSTQTAESQEASGVRIGNLLDGAAWPSAWRNIAAGDVTVQAFTPPCQSVLGLIRQVEDTEAGLTFIAGDGNFTFQDRSHRTGATPLAIFGDDGTELRYEDPVIDYSDEQIWNRVEVQRVGGAVVASEDATSIATYLERVLVRFETLHISDGDATTLATTLRDRFKDPYFRIAAITIQPQNRDPANLWPEALGREISDQITVKRRPAGGNVIDLDVWIEGVRHVINAADRSWHTTFSLSGRDA